MPVSLNPLESPLNEPSKQFNTTSGIKRRLKTTNKMVDDALIELHSVKGLTLKQIYNFMLMNYNLVSLSKVRVNLIKKHLTSLREAKDIVNITGKGLIGHFKLVDKSKFIKKVKTNTKQAKELFNATRRAKMAAAKELKNITSKRKPAKRTIKKPPISNIQISSIIPRQVTPVDLRNKNVSVFDTPILSSDVHASTPFINASYVPRAPELHKRVNRGKKAQDGLETPRSSLPAKKRRLRPE